MHIEKIIQNRLIQNILFWTFFAVIPFSMNLGAFGSLSNMYTDLQYYVECAAIGYFHNLVLMPRFFDSKQYIKYSLSLVLLLIAIILISGEITSILSPNYKQSFVSDIYDAIDFFIFVIAFGSGHLVRSYINQSKKISKLEEDKLTTEINFLKSQINPHLLFNTLNTIYSFSIANAAETPKMILKLSDIMRYMLYETNEERVTLQKELDYISDYISLQQLRIKDRGEVHFDISGSTEGAFIAPMLLISFVENAFKHSMDSMASGILIRVSIAIEGSKLKLHVINTYEKNASDERIGGIGLQNVQKRLDLLYEGMHDLNVNDNGNEYEIILHLNLHS